MGTSYSAAKKLKQCTADAEYYYTHSTEMTIIINL